MGFYLNKIKLNMKAFIFMCIFAFSLLVVTTGRPDGRPEGGAKKLSFLKRRPLQPDGKPDGKPKPNGKPKPDVKPKPNGAGRPKPNGNKPEKPERGAKKRFLRKLRPLQLQKK